MIGVFYIGGMTIAGYAGANNLFWGFIFLGSLIMSLGYVVARLPQLRNGVNDHGFGKTLLGLFFSNLLLSLITGTIYILLNTLVA